MGKDWKKFYTLQCSHCLFTCEREDIVRADLHERLTGHITVIASKDGSAWCDCGRWHMGCDVSRKEVE